MNNSAFISSVGHALYPGDSVIGTPRNLAHFPASKMLKELDTLCWPFGYFSTLGNVKFLETFLNIAQVIGSKRKRIHVSFRYTEISVTDLITLFGMFY